MCAPRNTLVTTDGSLSRSARPMHPCASSAPPTWPRYHVFGNGTFHSSSGIGGAHDVNALLFFRSHWHLMNQAGAPAGGTGWSHFVSDDLIRWRALDTSLGPSGWDGSATIVDGVPTILFDCQNDKACVSSAGSSSSDDRPVIGVARPRNISDDLLRSWRKDPNNPITVHGAAGNFAGPSNLWRTADGQRWRMVMITGQSTGLYETSAAGGSLHAWKLVNGSFYAARGGGGGLFHRLPSAASPTASRYTHYLQTDDASKGGRGDGTQWFVLGRHEINGSEFDPTAERLVPLDFSRHMVYATIGFAPTPAASMAASALGSSAAGSWSSCSCCAHCPSSDECCCDGAIFYCSAGATGDCVRCHHPPPPPPPLPPPPRQLHAGWIYGGPINLLSSIRSIGYDGERGLLTALPAEEYASLRVNPPRVLLGAWTPVPTDGSRKYLLTDGATSIDAELFIDLAATGDAGALDGGGTALERGAFSFQLGALGVALTLNVSSGRGGGPGKEPLDVTVAMQLGEERYVFAHPASETELAVRVLLDRVLVEAFVGQGRGVASVPSPKTMHAPSGKAPLWIAARRTSSEHVASPVRVKGQVWEMGCGWVM